MIDSPAPMSTASTMSAVEMPKGLRYLFGTWSGRILLLNTLVFLFICFYTHSIMLPDSAALTLLGAKDTVAIAQGEFWRFLTPIFLHIGVVHFAFNSYFLYAVGYQLERLLGAPWFIAIYLLAGIAGNLASAAFSVTMSAGASSSLFGLLGAGLFLERTIGTHIKAQTGRRPKQRAYLMTVAVNLGFGLLMPFIDNSAHLGGLTAGLILTAAMVNLRPNQLQPRRPLVGYSLLITLGLTAAGLGYYSMTPRLVVHRLEVAGDRASDPTEQAYLYSQALALSPDANAIILKHIRIFFSIKRFSPAFNDVRVLISRGEQLKELGTLADDLDLQGHQAESWELRRMLAHANQSI